MSKKKSKTNETISNVIVFHHRRFSEYYFPTFSTLENVIQGKVQKLKESIVLKNLTNPNDIVDYISVNVQNSIEKLYRKGLGITVAFGYDKEKDILFVGWARQSVDDVYSKSFGYRTSTTRLERIKATYNKLKEDDLIDDNIVDMDSEISESVKKTINIYLPRAKRYFKEASDKTEVIVWNNK